MTTTSPGGAVIARPCHVSFQGMPAVEAARVEVQAWLERLRPLTLTMTGGTVVIEAMDERRKERRYRVRMELAMPDRIVAIEHDHPRNAPHEDVHVAIRNAFRAAKGPLEAYSAAQPASEAIAADADASGDDLSLDKPGRDAQPIAAQRDS